jgi:hypothetical protein
VTHWQCSQSLRLPVANSDSDSDIMTVTVPVPVTHWQSQAGSDSDSGADSHRARPGGGCHGGPEPPAISDTVMNRPSVETTVTIITGTTGMLTGTVTEVPVPNLKVRLELRQAALPRPPGPWLGQAPGPGSTVALGRKMPVTCCKKMNFLNYFEVRVQVKLFIIASPGDLVRDTQGFAQRHILTGSAKS